MGRRTRKRASVSATPSVAGRTAQAPPLARRARMGEAPSAPWSPFPLVEVCVLLAIVLIVLGLLSDGGRRSGLLAGGIALASLAGLELAFREHLAGFRSHSALLAGAAGVVVVVPLSLLTGLRQIAVLGLGAGVYALSFVGLRRMFQARTGGMGFRA
ncbi:MAG: hypothetical protein QOC64_3472 [Solirubrobacteraceae bacterium]|nr:hypothetical protein [Solirubrobacteraceae bacterium]